MSKVVLDSSAVIAALNKEPGGIHVLARLGEAVISAVNFAEVVSTLARTGGDITHVISDVQELLPEIRPFDAKQALVAGMLDARTLKLGLSSGGRACLALAKCLDVPVLTADPTWANLDIGVKIELVRSVSKEAVAH
jgi:ribonuclease VapC